MNRITTFLFLIVVLPALAFAQTTVELNPVKDNTLYETDNGELSNGAGEFLFFGQTGTSASNKLRRAVLAFDIAGTLPAGAMVKSATLSITVSRVNATDPLTTNLHRMGADWGEGASDAPGQEGAGAQSETDDATWLHSFFSGTTWATPGGDFATPVSSTVDIGGTGTYVFEGLGAEVQSMLEIPDENWGWIIIGDETVANGAKRIDGRSSSGMLPVLTVTYDPLNTSTENEIPNSISFSEIYPNPFSSSMTFRLGLDRRSQVNVVVYDFMGRQVAELMNGEVFAGDEKVLIFESGDLPAGNYFIVAQTETDSRMQKVTLVN